MLFNNQEQESTDTIDKVEYVKSVTDMNNVEVVFGDTVAVYDTVYEDVSVVGTVIDMQMVGKLKSVRVEHILKNNLPDANFDYSFIAKSSLPKTLTRLVSPLWIEKLTEDRIIELKLRGYSFMVGSV